MADPDFVGVLLARIARWRQPGLYTIGICGAQGSGKSTLVAALAEQLVLRGVRTATLSLDDLYRTRTQRMHLAKEVHSLFAVRGVPGTHDLALGRETLDAVKRGEPAPLPRFDKASDDRMPIADWPRAPHGTQVLLLEGWCLGAAPQEEKALAQPVNELERDEDPDCRWRGHVNAALAGDYQRLFERVNRLVFLAAPSWDVVATWREEQEAGLRGQGGTAVMSPAEVSRFIQHYERLTRHIVATMPDYADLTVRLDERRAVTSVS
ncbi:kinase [Novosphingobium sp.]|uniref:kinase n=1 Tax=Novosphingobium sp. TaxID=1874826 RepID=UPI0025F74ECC|nr:kinase [Novosphingobium sp.]